MNKEKTNKVLDYFEELFPDAHCELNHQNVIELLVAVMLSAQTTDKKVNIGSLRLFNDNLLSTQQSYRTNST